MHGGAEARGEKSDRRGATYKSSLTSGFICDGDVPIANGKPLTPKDASLVTINANADGVRGSGKRVKRRFPSFDKWHGVAEFTIVDDIITTEVFEHHLKSAGMIVVDRPLPTGQRRIERALSRGQNRMA